MYRLNRLSDLNPAHSPTTFRSLSQATPPALSRLMEHARQLHHTTLAIRKFLPTPLDEHCQPGNIHHYTLILYTSSPAWATRLRYFVPDLIKFLRTRPPTAHIRHIRIIVQPRSPVQAKLDTKRPRLLSQENARLLRHAATTARSPRLSAALHRLSRHVLKRQ